MDKKDIELLFTHLDGDLSWNFYYEKKLEVEKQAILAAKRGNKYSKELLDMLKQSDDPNLTADMCRRIMYRKELSEEDGKSLNDCFCYELQIKIHQYANAFDDKMKFTTIAKSLKRT